MSPTRSVFLLTAVLLPLFDQATYALNDAGNSTQRPNIDRMGDESVRLTEDHAAIEKSFPQFRLRSQHADSIALLR